ncbi:MAG TPA: phosphate signaling complex protein PhoU [Mycobacterium sp.]|nr:phosphate signaling complex protein PhoU [Mycobacterium sp.]
MRSAYGAQLAALTEQLAQVCQLTGTAMERGTRALLHADLVLAEEVISAHHDIRAAGAKVQEAGLLLLASQTVVARDLRAVICSIQIVADLERMGALALHVAEIARLRHPQIAIPRPISGYFAEMGRTAIDLGDKARQVIVSSDLGLARHIRDADDAMDDIHRHLFTVLMDRKWQHGITAAVDVTLLSRYYERFADHAVEISRRIIFQATGQGLGDEWVPAPRLAPRSARLADASPLR